MRPLKQSTNIESFEYFPASRAMVVEFNGGTGYAYENVTPEMNATLNAVNEARQSVGAWIIANLVRQKTEHPCKQVGVKEVHQLLRREHGDHDGTETTEGASMTRDELAHIMNGKGYDPDIDRSTEQRAKEAGLVIVYGASDDLMEFRGAISDEAGAPGDVAITKDGILQSKCGEGDECPYFAVIREKATTITAVWCDDSGDDATWTYKTTLPHSTFELHDGDEFYCRGIVFEMKDVAA